MEFMILIHGDETSGAPATGTVAFDDMAAGWAAFDQRLVDGGHWISGAHLGHSASTTTVRRAWAGETTVADGPCEERREQLARFYLVSAADLGEAVGLARNLPPHSGSVEVRPVAARPVAAQAGQRRG